MSFAYSFYLGYQVGPDPTTAEELVRAVPLMHQAMIWELNGVIWGIMSFTSHNKECIEAMDRHIKALETNPK
jgi:hypothetical protein